jgi:hypothetical protein
MWPIIHLYLILNLFLFLFQEHIHILISIYSLVIYSFNTYVKWMLHTIFSFYFLLVSLVRRILGGKLFHFYWGLNTNVLCTISLYHTGYTIKEEYYDINYLLKIIGLSIYKSYYVSNQRRKICDIINFIKIKKQYFPFIQAF